jgi:aminomethyltransferase
MLAEKGIMRTGQRVILADGSEGVITSGTYSPTLEQSIALARIPITTNEKAMVEIRGKLLQAKIGKPRFVKKGRRLW